MADQMMQYKTDEMAAKQTIPVGYKQTEVGVIPEDWDISIIGDIANVKTGPFGSALHEKDYVHNGTPIITVEHLGEMGITGQNLPMVSDTDRVRLRAYQLDEGDIVFSRVGSIDRNALVTEGESGWLFSGRLLRVKLKSGCNSPKYISYHFHSAPFKKRVIEVAVGQTMPSLNTKILNGLLVVLPKTTEEQTAIAAVLSDTDSLIVGLEQLIAKKQAIKTATMQQLLTGRTRLPQFALRPDGTPKGYKTSEPGQIPEDWTIETLGGVTEIVRNGSNYSSVAKDGVAVTRIETIATGFVDVGRTGVAVRESIHESYRVLRGDILYSHINSIDHIGKVARFDDDIELFHGINLILIRTSAVNSLWLFKLLSGEEARKWARQVAKQAVSQASINTKELKGLLLAVPSTQEQTAIATILSDMDSELTALEQKLAKARDVKQGMMQQLLTGRIRLPLPQEA
ncbi:restriction endonuclease subunit S [Aeromonas hydrophila]|uniref:restriction endonuclease subunit S n=1 Tax=Aeromonas hydrophila TaxID=644 RepID=UPI00256EAD3A|nr:restriction endonuclease subunit S [Aeromonas hydrophila]MDL5384383.1 restriction endonuclease subunit S [Aeromonas hydrophila]